MNIICRQLTDLVKSIRGYITNIGVFVEKSSMPDIAVFKRPLCAGKEYPYLHTELKLANGRPPRFDVTCFVVYMNLGLWKTDMHLSTVVDMVDMGAGMTAGFIKGDGTSLYGYLVDFDRNYGRCVEIIKTKHPWLAPVWVHARHETMTRLLRPGHSIDRRIKSLDAEWADRQTKNMMTVAFTPVYDEDTVVDVELCNLMFDFRNGSAHLEDTARRYLLERRLEAL